MEIKFIPHYFIGTASVSESEKNTILQYVEKDTKNFIGKTTESAIGHDLFISSPTHSDIEDNIDYKKYDEILNKYIVSFVNQLTDYNFGLELLYYTNIYVKGQFAGPHYDDGDFTMIYFAKCDENSPATSVELSKNWLDLQYKFEKLPTIGGQSFDFKGIPGNIFFFPSSNLHWVLSSRSESERIVIVANVTVKINK